MQTVNSTSIYSGLVTDLLTSFDTLTSQLYQNIMAVRLRNALFTGSLAHQVAAQSNCSQPSVSVDLTWHAPNATNINNLAYVVNGTGVNGAIFNSSITPVSTSYSTYNWCNMPHVRRQEYPRAPQDYTLEYVEIVSGCFPCSRQSPSLTSQRFTAIINEHLMQATPFRKNHTHGTVTTRPCSTMAFPDRTDPQLRFSGRSSLRLPTRWHRTVSMGHVSSHRSRGRASMIPANMERIYSTSTTTCSNSCLPLTT